MKTRHIAAIAVAVFAAAVYLNNASWLAPGATARPTLLAHRGVAQDYPHEGLTNDTCTATRIYPPANPYLENTVPSLAASFRAGADIAEIDIHPTTDGAFAVFHDWTLDCRTNGHGVTRQHSMRYLKTLDIGYGYTADGGKTFPFRGKGIGLMPSLDEVLARFPDERFLVNIKSNDPAEGEKLARYLTRRGPADRARLMFYGGAEPLHVLAARVPHTRVMALKGSAPNLRTCLIRYESIGWTGYVPQDCRHSLAAIPINYAPYLWGWPNRFVARMKSVDTDVFVAGPYDGVSQGIDAKGIAALPANYAGGIWTDDIEGVARLYRHRAPGAP
jgi:glycerophosphoryl diester phosphodiesterase